MSSGNAFEFLDNGYSANPFHFTDSVQADLIGRDADLAWLIDGLGKREPLYFRGPNAPVKSSLVFQASLQLAQEGPTAIFQVDLSNLGTTKEFAQLVWGSAVRFVPEASPTKLGVVGHFAESADVPGGLFSAMEKLNSVAGARSQRFVFAINGYGSGMDGGRAEMAEGLAESLRAHRNLSFIFCGDSVSIAGPQNSASKLEEMLQSRNLNLSDPFRIAAWINAKFATAAIAASAIGEACVENGGYQTSEIIGLARDVFAMARTAGVATERTVQQVMNRRVSENRIFLAASWNALSQSEQETFAQLSKYAPSPFGKRPAFDASTGSDLALRSLIQKKLIAVLPDGRAVPHSPIFRRWAMRAEIAVGISRGTSLEGKKTAIHFGFGFSAENNLSTRRNVGVPRGLNVKQ